MAASHERFGADISRSALCDPNLSQMRVQSAGIAIAWSRFASDCVWRIGCTDFVMSTLKRWQRYLEQHGFHEANSIHSPAYTVREPAAFERGPKQPPVGNLLETQLPEDQSNATAEFMVFDAGTPQV
jgi:hypothetical protein